MTRSRSIVWVVAGILGLTVLIWALTRQRAPSEGPLETSAQEGLGATDSSPLTLTRGPNPPLSPDAPTEARSSVPRSFTLRTDDGRAVSAATISWTPVRAEWLARAVSESDRAWAEIETGSKLATSSTTGAFELTFDASQRAVLWITHPTCEATYFQNVGGGSLTLPDSITLTRVDRTVAHVRQEDGTAVAGALVQHCASLWNVPLDDSRVDSVARRLFQRQYRTGPDGNVEVHALPGYQGLTASLDDRVSNLWTGLRPCAPLLVLRPSFLASGTVPKHAATDPSTVSDRVLVTTVIDTLGEEVGYLTVRSDGNFGPVRLPCRPAKEYSYTLESEIWQAKVIRRPAPRPGDTVHVDFPGEPGLKIDVDTVSATGTPIEGVRVGMSTECGDGMVMSQAFTSKEGRATFRNMRPGDVIITTNKDGFSPTRSGRFTFFSEPGVPYRIELQPGATLRGRVVQDGKPVPKFTVHMWNDEVNYDDERHFQDRVDGSFEVGDVPAGPFTVVASALPSARSQDTAVSIPPGESGSVELVLVPGIIGTGSVLAASTGAPIAGASIQPYLVAGSRSLGAFGPAQTSGPDGSFRFAGFGTGTNLCVVHAEGYAPATFQAVDNGNDSVEFGWMSLQRSGRLDVEFAADSDAPVEHYAVELRPGNSSTRKRLDLHGRASLVDVSPGRCEANVNLGRGVGVSSYVNIGPVAPTRWDVQHRRVRALVAALHAPRADERTRYYCNATYSSPSGREEFYFAPFDADLRCDLSRIPADTMILDVVTDDMVTVATRWVTSGKSAPQVVDIELVDAPLHLHFVTQSGAPVFPANVQFNQSKDNLTWSTSLATDEHGDLTLSSVPEGPFSLVVISPQFRKWMRCPPVAGRTDQKLEIVVSTEGGIDVDVRDRSTPLGGLRVELQDPIGQQCTFDTKSTGPDGRVRFDALEPQDFDVSVSELGYWPTRMRVLPSASGSHAEMQVRRLGGARIRASIVGTPLRKRELNLRSVEFDVDVRSWVSSARVQANPATLETDDDGRLSIDGLPNGLYRWSTTSSEGAPVEGEFTVLPRAVAEVHVAIP